VLLIEVIERRGVDDFDFWRQSRSRIVERRRYITLIIIVVIGRDFAQVTAIVRRHGSIVWLIIIAVFVNFGD
jgi:hypothetical protein